MKLTVSIKVESEDYGLTEKTIMRDIEDENNLGDLASAILDTIPHEMFPPFDVLEIFSQGLRVGHGEK